MEGSIAPTTPGQTKEAPKTATSTFTSAAAFNMEYYNRFQFVIGLKWVNGTSGAVLINMEYYNWFLFVIGSDECEWKDELYLYKALIIKRQ